MIIGICLAIEMLCTLVFFAVTFVGAFSDIRVVAGSITAVVILVMQGINLWKTFSTNKVVHHNSQAISRLHGTIDGDIRKQLETLKATSESMKATLAHTDLTISHLETLIERRTATTPNPAYTGDRDRRMTPRAAPRVVEPIHDPRADFYRPDFGSI